MANDHWTIESSEEYAIYTYPQALINCNSNKPFFVASPKLFALMFDDKDVPTSSVSSNGDEITAREITLNNETVEVVKLGQIADVKVGLQTGDNDSYLFQNPEARGTYRDINDYQEYLLTEDDLKHIQQNEELRMDVIENGISKDDPDSDRYFEGRYIVPYDKGGSSDAAGGWMPNYWVPTDYFIDWSEWAVDRMKNYTIADRIRENNESKEIKEHYETTTCAVLRNTDYYFTDSVSFSRTGVYSPTFRIGSSATFDTEGSVIVQDFFDTHLLIGFLTSRYLKFQAKNFIGHTVHTQVDELKEVSLPTELPSLIQKKVDRILHTQKSNKEYDYAVNEQLVIDKLVYESLGLNEQDIQEVENWYARRYPLLVEAQKENLAEQGKSTDYLELYEELEEERVK
jgi:hypothetical protein